MIVSGSIQLGEEENELIFKYCESCEPIIYNLNDEGEHYSENYGAFIGWTLTDSTFLIWLHLLLQAIQLHIQLLIYKVGNFEYLILL